MEQIQVQAVSKYAGFWKRFAAYLIDSVILGIVGLIISAIANGAYDPVYMDGAVAYNPGSGMATWILILVGWIYFAVMESSVKQGTLGKIALGIKVTDLNGARISFGRATGRHFAKIISTIIILIGFLMIAWTKQKQALHDKIAKCLVVNKEA